MKLWVCPLLIAKIVIRSPPNSGVFLERSDLRAEHVTDVHKPSTETPNSRLHQIRLLASVKNAAEAVMALEAGADVIDCKDPSKGALGALSIDTVREIRSIVPRHVPLSATAGDLIPDAKTVFAATETMAATGVDYVKIGFFPGGDARATIRALGAGTFGQTALVGLLLADRDPDFDLIRPMAAAGFSGVMIDTADKHAGALPDVTSRDRLTFFLSEARHFGMFAGLAGSLRLEHIPGLLALRPGLLGFRGALCRAADRSGILDHDAIAAVRRAIPSGFVRGDDLAGLSPREVLV
jgi:(5-formylfuran-3-yl)methyl phosphate synthase